MARKQAKRASAKPAKKTSKKTAMKVATKAAKTTHKPAAGKSRAPAARPVRGTRRAAPSSGAAPRSGVEPISTGRGASPVEIGRALVDAFNAGTPDEQIWDRWFSPHIASIEGVGVGMAWYGREAVAGKAAAWSAENRVISASAAGPFVGSTGFAVRFTVEVESRTTGARQSMDEVGVYTVQDGRVVREEFMYKVEASTPGSAAGDTPTQSPAASV